MRVRGGAGEARVGDLLKVWREQRNLTQLALAGRLDRPQSYVSKYERAKHTLSLPEIEAICRELRFTLQQFVYRYQAPSRPADRR